VKNPIFSIGLDYNETFRTNFDLAQVDMDAAGRVVEAFCQSYDFDGKSGLIYGAGTSGALALRLLPGVGIRGFLDIAPAKTAFQDLPVVHPAKAQWPDILLVAVCPSNYLSVMKTLSGLIPESCDLVFLWRNEFFDPKGWAALQTDGGSRNATGVAPACPNGAPEHGDQRGRVYFEGNQTLRTILEQDFDFYHALVRDEQRLGRLMELGVVETWVETDEPGRLVLAHKSLLAQSRANWSFSQYLDAARFFVDFWEALSQEGYSLQDCHTDNVLFDQTRPCFVDFCSIGPVEATILSGPLLESFFSAWVYPLALVNSNQHTLMRETIRRYLSWDEVRPLLSPEVAQTVAELREAAATRFQARDLSGFLELVRQWLGNVVVSYSKVGWDSEEYQADSLDDARPRGGKEQLVVDLISRHKPDAFLDLGCNKGRFSLLSASCGIPVIGLDTAESLIDKLYLHARDNNLPIHAFIEDVAAFGGYQNPERRVDMVAYLALVHHLVFTFGKTISQVLDQADKLCKRVLLLEYVAPHESEPFVLSNYSPELHPEYNPETMANLLRSRYDTVEAHRMGATRTLFVAVRG
jgi:2-polyprenyl-3-methyl-5-hydroxy-6-metoxy-1,4-benzoquinol methylase